MEIENFHTFDTVEVSYKSFDESGKSGYWFFEDVLIMKGFTLDWMVDVERNSYDSFYLCELNSESFYKLMDIQKVCTTRLVLLEKLNKNILNNLDYFLVVDPMGASRLAEDFLDELNNDGH